MTEARTIRVDLPCGCDTLVHVPCIGPDVGVVIAVCVDDAHRADNDPSLHRFLVTWCQLVTATVVPLQEPSVELAPGVTIANVEPVSVDAASKWPDWVPALGTPAGHLIDEKPLDNEPPGLKPGEVLSSPRTADEWKTEAHHRGCPHSILLVRARELATQHKLEPPRDLDAIDQTLTPLLVEWLDRNHPTEESF